MRLLTATLFLTLTAWAASADDAKDAKEAAKKLEGTYDVLEVIIEGKPSPKKEDVQSVVIKDDEIIIKLAKRDEPAKFTLDPSKKPGHIDISPKDGKGQEKLAGIYEVKETDKGTELTICFAEDKKERPKDFKGEGKDTIVLKLFRKKAK